MKNSNGMNATSDVIIFTDGSSRGNPGPGGFAAIIIMPQADLQPTTHNQQQIVIEIGGREEHTTNNRMELRAAIEALKFIQNQGLTLNREKGRTLILYSDSSYVINGITKWVFGWRKNNWITATKKPVENRDLWEQLVKVTQGKNIQWQQIGGHVGVAGNERCDEIATAFADLMPTDAANKLKLYSGSLENYPIKNILNLFDISNKKQEAKNISRAHQKAQAYSYVSMVDGKILTHNTWTECEARVKGKRAKFKKTVSSENEKEIITEFSSGV